MLHPRRSPRPSEPTVRHPLADRFELGAGGDQPAVTIEGQSVSYSALQALVDRLPPPPGGLLDLSQMSAIDALAAVFAAARSGTAVLVRAPGSTPVALDEVIPGALLVVMTSGTSGRPRAVVRTAASWSSSFRPFAELTGLSGADTVLLTGPLQSTLHLFAAVHTLWLGAHLTDDPERATAVHAVPSVAADLLEDPPPTLRTIVVAGAPLPPGLEDRALARGLTLVEYYGAAELSFVAARVAPARLTAFPGVEIRIVDGELWARSPYLALGCVVPGNHVGSALPTRDGFVTVRDRVDADPDGALVIRGRGDAAVITGGHTVLAEDVEAAIGVLPGVRAVAVIGVPHARLGQVVAAVIELTTEGRLADVRRTARLVLNGAALPRRWLVVERLPRTAGGKVARSGLAGLAGLDRESSEAPPRSVR